MTYERALEIAMNAVAPTLDVDGERIVFTKRAQVPSWARITEQEFRAAYEECVNDTAMAARFGWARDTVRAGRRFYGIECGYRK